MHVLHHPQQACAGVLVATVLMSCARTDLHYKSLLSMSGIDVQDIGKTAFRLTQLVQDPALSCCQRACVRAEMKAVVVSAASAIAG